MENNKSTAKLTRSLICAFIGKTAGGKSTLINTLAGEHLCIVSNRTQTTRQLLRAIIPFRDAQIVITDTPGYQEKPSSSLARAMNRTLAGALANPDLVVWVIDVLKYIKDSDGENRLIDKIFAPIANNSNREQSGEQPDNNKTHSAIVLNKIDKLGSKAELLPIINRLSQKYPESEIIPISALTGLNINELWNVLYKHTTDIPPMFPEDEIADLGEKYFASEFLREELYRTLYQELPFSCAVSVDKFEYQEKKPTALKVNPKNKNRKKTIKTIRQTHRQILHIALTIHISAESHKPIILGEKGQKLKYIATQARVQMEKFFNCPVFLQTWIKVNPNWQNQAKYLKEFGYL